eukprot:TRINITY_DN12994_c0_g2_i1.p1 TRINITY_DN12994_c0_g2~~TRINITY_DN12994_c0_g2_i1.p1  ORF type:complete len:296 (-),score=-12.24 TRINITY_DN12994_c0_g2_i1:125-1012(-)
MGTHYCKDIVARSKGQVIQMQTLAGLYVIFECFYTYQSIWVLCKLPGIRKDCCMVLFFGATHLLIISGIFCFLADVVICYPPDIYKVIYNYACILKHTMIFAIMYQVIKFLKHIRPDYEGRKCFKMIVKSFWISDFFAFTYLYILGYHILNNIIYPEVYVILVTFMITVLFNILMYSLSKALNDYIRETNLSSKRLWVTLLILVNAFFTMRLLHKGMRIFREINKSFDCQARHSTAYIVFTAFYFVMTELLIPEVFVLAIRNMVKQRVANEREISDELSISSKTFIQCRNDLLSP